MSIILFIFIVLFGNYSNICTCDMVALGVIYDLHNELDDNKDGLVDINEVVKFTHKELNCEPNLENSTIFKSFVTKDRLWNSWKSSQSYNWTVDDVIVWLKIHIGLPEYTSIFLMNNVSGSMIPRLSLSNSSFLHNNLKIINQEHCKKIVKISKEIILFDVPKDIGNKFSKDNLSFEAIKQLHFQLDGDQNGGIDLLEADEFVRDGRQLISDFDRIKGLNKNSDYISKEELWRNWKSSDVFNWTVSDVVEWLALDVELPQYANRFYMNNVNGSFIPRFALSNQSYLIKELKIQSSVHRKKLVLKATDLFLFGLPKRNLSITKDVTLLSFVILSFTGCWIAFMHHQYSKKQLSNMRVRMDELCKAEESLFAMQNKLEKTEIQNCQVISEKLKIEEKLKLEREKFKDDRSDSNEEFSKYTNFNDELFNQLNFDQNFSQNLKLLLQITYEIEGHFFSIKRLVAEQQMRNVKEISEKLRKKKNTFIGLLKMSHLGNQDDVDKLLSDAKHSFDEVRNDFNERSQRWECIEKLTRLKIIPTPGLTTLFSTLKTNYCGGLIYGKHFTSIPISDLGSATNVTDTFIKSINGPHDSVGFNNNDTSCSSTRSRSLKFLMNDGCSEDIMSSLGAMDTISDIIEHSHHIISMPKSSSVSNSLFHLRTNSSQCSFFDHSSITDNEIYNSHTISEIIDNDSNAHMSQVRPFAFRWLKKLNKSKMTSKKSKHI